LTNPMTTAGDIIKGGAAGVPERLAIGSSNWHLVSNGAAPLWMPQPSGGGSALTVADEGSPLSTDATTLDFVGAGVTASGAGATKTITIPGGGSSASEEWWTAANAPGSPDAANREFTSAPSDTRVANGTPRGTWAHARDGYEWTHTVTGGSELDVWAIARTVSIGDHVTIAYRGPPYNPNYIGAAVGFSNGTTYGTSNAIASFAHLLSIATNRHMINQWPGHNTRATDSTIEDYGAPGLVWGIRVKYEAANTWGFYIRSPGISAWRLVQTGYAYTMTPTHVVYGVSLLTPTFTANKGAGMRLECFRVND
jgi:hypothetical protein